MHAEAQSLAAALLAALDRAAPGAATALYVTGSAALDDFYVGKSDLDFVAVVARALSAEEGAALVAALPEARRYDGVFFEAGDLAAGPDALAGPRLTLADGAFALRGDGGQRNPVTWATLAQSGAAVRGALPEDLWRDDARVAAWVRENLRGYWSGRRRAAARLLSRAGVQSLSAWFCEWCVLGVARQHVTLTRGRIVSKSEAGARALAAFPAHRRVIEEALRVRAGEGAARYASPFARRRDVLAFMEVVEGAV